MKVRVIDTYRDLQLNRTVLEGETITVSKDRAEYLLKLKLVEVVEEPKRTRKKAR